MSTLRNCKCRKCIETYLATQIFSFKEIFISCVVTTRISIVRYEHSSLHLPTVKIVHAVCKCWTNRASSFFHVSFRCLSATFTIKFVLLSLCFHVFGSILENIFNSFSHSFSSSFERDFVIHFSVQVLRSH